MELQGGKQAKKKFIFWTLLDYGSAMGGWYNNNNMVRKLASFCFSSTNVLCNVQNDYPGDKWEEML